MTINKAFLLAAERAFLYRTNTYPWNRVVETKKRGDQQAMAAVTVSTFRGFHKHGEGDHLIGAKQVFVKFFQGKQTDLCGRLLTVKDRKDLNYLSNEIVDQIRPLLADIQPAQLKSYNKLRKPIDLYLEHLVAMATELREARSRLVPLLYLPLDKDVLAHPDIFTEEDLDQEGLKRGATYSAVKNSGSYDNLQRRAEERANEISSAIGLACHPIYLDLVWSDRWRTPSGMLMNDCKRCFTEDAAS